MSIRTKLLSGIGVAGVLAILLFLPSVHGASKTKLQLVVGGGEFTELRDKYTVDVPEALNFTWSTGEVGAVGGVWQVMIANTSNMVAHGVTSAPKTPGHWSYFTIPKTAFLEAVPSKTPKTYYVTITPYDVNKKPLGEPSAAVTITQQASVGGSTFGTSFGPSAVFPALEIVTYDEKIGVVPLTQLRFAGADVTLRVSNKGKTATDPIWLSVTDQNVLMRQKSLVSVPGLKPGGSQLVNVHLDAILPPSKSQLESYRYSDWDREYRDRCGVDLRGVMDWRGPQDKAPFNAHLETILAQQGEGWGDYTKFAPSTPICDSQGCVSVCQIAKNIHAQLDGHAVGYSFFVGLYPKFDAYGQARTSADGVTRDFTPETKITVASVSKMVTAIAAVRILAKKGVSLNSPIGPYLPSDWSVSNYVKNITFAQLLGQRSGIKDYGNVPPNNYATLKNFFTQSVSNSSTTTCQPAKVIQPSSPINPNDMSWCYSNYNFAIFRILLPKVAGFSEDPNPFTRPQTLADQYTKLVQQNVFDLVGQKGVACKPPSGNPFAPSYAVAHNYPGTNIGYDWGDVSLTCGAAGWYLSVEDLAKVFLSLNAKDGKILSAAQFNTMRTRGLGCDVCGYNNNYKIYEFEKNGGWSENCDSNGNHCGNISTSIAIFGPADGPGVIGVLFINSDISGGPSAGGGAQSVLEKAYKNALTPKP